MRFPGATHLVILCRWKGNALEAKRRVEKILAELGLKLSEEKTRIVELTRGKEGFDFLGFHHRKKESWRYRGRYYLLTRPCSKKVKALYEKVRKILNARTLIRSVTEVVKALNRLLKGWGGYYRYGNSSRHFTRIDNHVRMKLSKWLSRKHKRRGIGWKRYYRAEYFKDIGLYQLTGTVRWYSAKPNAAR